MPASDADRSTSGDQGDRDNAGDRDNGREGGTDNGPDDGGVLRRLVRRSRTGAVVLTIVGIAGLVVALLPPSGIVTVTAALLAVALIAIGVVLAVRTALWSGMANATRPLKAGTPAIIGQVTALSPTRAGAPLRRRLGATVVPVAMRIGPQPGGGALLIHARADGVALGGGDDVEVWRATRAGPDALPHDDREAIPGRFVLRRQSDGAVFYGTSRLTDVV